MTDRPSNLSVLFASWLRPALRLLWITCEKAASLHVVAFPNWRSVVSIYSSLEKSLSVTLTNPYRTQKDSTHSCSLADEAQSLGFVSLYRRLKLTALLFQFEQVIQSVFSKWFVVEGVV